MPVTRVLLPAAAPFRPMPQPMSSTVRGARRLAQRPVLLLDEAFPSGSMRDGYGEGATCHGRGGVELRIVSGLRLWSTWRSRGAADVGAGPSASLTSMKWRTEPR